MMCDHETFVKEKRESFLYRVFRADSVRDLDQQEFTYLGAEIYFDEQGKVYRYEEPVFDFDGFHAFIKDKYDHYQIDQFILVTREGQFNIRYFPLTGYAPEEHTELVDDVELVGFRMFPDLLPIGADLLLSVLDKDPMEDVEHSIATFERLLGLIEGDENPFLKVQLVLNLVRLYFQQNNLQQSLTVINQIDIEGYNPVPEPLLYNRFVRKTLEGDFPAKYLFDRDVGSYYQWKAIILYEGSKSYKITQVLDLFNRARSHWMIIGHEDTEDLIDINLNIAQILQDELFDLYTAEKYFKEAIKYFNQLTELNHVQVLQKSITLSGIGDYFTARLILEEYLRKVGEFDMSTLFHLYLAGLYMREDHKLAREHLNTAITEARGSGDTNTLYRSYRLFSQLAFITGGYNKVQEMYEEYLSLEPKNEPAYSDYKKYLELYSWGIQLDFEEFQNLISPLIREERPDQGEVGFLHELVWMYILKLLDNPVFEKKSVHKTLLRIGEIVDEFNIIVLQSIVDQLLNSIHKEHFANELDNFLHTEVQKFDHLPFDNIAQATLGDLLEYLHWRVILINILN